MNVEKCNKCHWNYFVSKAPFHCNYCLLQSGQTGFKPLDKGDKEHKQFKTFKGEMKI
jgi:hypothetical protein